MCITRIAPGLVGVMVVGINVVGINRSDCASSGASQPAGLTPVRFPEANLAAASSAALIPLPRSIANRMQPSHFARVFGLQGALVFPLLAQLGRIGYL